jgi:[acyl-carrier-protein] S-malonyltransferase
MQIVVSGSQAGVDKAREVLKAMVAKRFMPLPVSAPFHCSLMRPAAEALRERLAAVSFSAPRLALVNNVDVAVQSDPDAIRDALYRQAFGPVRWVEVVQALRQRGLTHVLECGPGKVLTGMVRRIDAELHTGSVFDPASLLECMDMVV